MKRKAVMALIAFVVAMGCFALLSSTVSSSSIAIVETSSASSQTIAKGFDVWGTVECKMQTVVFTEPNQIIGSTMVNEGDRVKRGDVLFKVDEKTLQDGINTAYRSIRKIDLEIENLLSSQNDGKENSGTVSGSQSEIGEDSKNSLNDNSSRTVENQIESLRIDQLSLQEQCDRLVALRDNGCVGVSPIDGIVSSILSNTGSATSTGAVMLIADPGQGLIVKASVPMEDTSLLTSEHVANITMTDGSLIKDVPISASVSDGGDTIELLASLDATEFLGMQAKIGIIISSEMYGTCLPMSALHQEGGQYYVYVVQEAEAVTGEELHAQRVNVTLEAYDEKYAALAAGSISPDQIVIERSSRVLSNGDRVRISNE